jgi:dinuclear metal center YbgI/SA1388 family protein
MNGVSATQLAAFLDDELQVPIIPDYPNALNGLQVDHHGPVLKLAAAVDCSTRTIARAIEEKANYLIVHHGMFWGGVRPIRGPLFERFAMLFANDVALYSSHLPLDRHPQLGNNVLLANAIKLTPLGEFAKFRSTSIGVWGEASLTTRELIERMQQFSREHGGEVRVSTAPPDHVTRRWALCSGSGASSETIAEAAALDVDTLIVGEGSHHTAVEAEELGMCIIYAGHYATEILGVQAIATRC